MLDVPVRRKVLKPKRRVIKKLKNSRCNKIRMILRTNEQKPLRFQEQRNKKKSEHVIILIFESKP